MSIPIRKLVAIWLLCITICGGTFAADVTLQLVDQASTQIPASRFYIRPDGPWVAQGGTEWLEPGTYNVRVYPGMNNSISSKLYRTETITVTSDGAQAIDLVWPTATLSFDIVDQDGISIDGSTGRLYDITNASPLAFSILLPVTEDLNHLDIGGEFATGYRVYLYPGVNGVASNRLFRHELDNELPVGGASYDFVWRTATFEYDIVDQAAVHIPGSLGRLYNVTDSDPLSASVVLPVTEDLDYPNIGGDFATGYRVYLYPGVNGVASNRLFRHELDNELPVGGASYDFVWRTATLSFDVVDQFDNLIDGSTGCVKWITDWNLLPLSIDLPVTTDPGGKEIKGEWSEGYRFDMEPGVNGVASNRLSRIVHNNKLTVDGEPFHILWPTAPVEFDLVDQNGDHIPGSKGYVYPWDDNYTHGLPYTAVLPVTEDPGLPNIHGERADGYRFKLFPGINGKASNDLLRNEWDNVLTVDGLNIDFVWLTLKCNVGVVDAAGELIPGSYVGDFEGTYNNCEIVTFPTTDELVHTTMTGAFRDGYPISLYPGGTLAGTATFEVTENLDFAPSLVTLSDADYGLRCVPLQGSVAGRVTAECPAAGTGLLGVTVDVFDGGANALVASAATDQDGYYQIVLAAGEYTLSIVTPLGYNAATSDLLVTVEDCFTVPADFNLSCVEITASPRAAGFWKHQVGVALGGHGNAQIDGATLCDYLDIVKEHFNSNEINQVVVYDPPPSADCPEKLQVAKSILIFNGKAEKIVHARKQLMALLLNVAAGYIGLTDIVDGVSATVSQAITYCDHLIDGPIGGHELAKTICENINTNEPVTTGLIPLETDNIAYKQVPAIFSLSQNYPNPFNPTTEICFSLPASEDVSLLVYDILGRRVAAIALGRFAAGRHSVTWNAGDQASGVYFYRLEAGSFVETRKMVLLK